MRHTQQTAKRSWTAAAAGLLGVLRHQQQRRTAATEAALRTTAVECPRRTSATPAVGTIPTEAAAATVFRVRQQATAAAAPHSNPAAAQIFFSGLTTLGRTSTWPPREHLPRRQRQRQRWRLFPASLDPRLASHHRRCRSFRVLVGVGGEKLGSRRRWRVIILR